MVEFEMADSYYSYRYPYYSNYYARPSDKLSRTQSSSDVDRTGSLSQLFGSFSSDGSYDGMGGSSGGSCFSLDICPDILLALIAAAAAAGFYFLYITITMAGRKRRKRREAPVECEYIYHEDDVVDNDSGDWSQIFSDFINLGMKQFIKMFIP